MARDKSVRAPAAVDRIEVADDLELPLDLVTQAVAVLGRRGSGKTHTGVVLVEGMVGAGLQVAVVDPLDVWLGVRWAAGGKRPGLPMAIFGGEGADLPLEDGQGALLADILVDEGVSAVFSVRHLSKAGQRRFVAAFAERLYERKGQSQHRTPLHLVLDEADAFAPQVVRGDIAACYGAIDTLVRRGRASGMGVTLITQRSAVLNKDVLSQIELLIAHQTTSPQDRKALKAWVDAHDTAGHGKEFLDSLAALQRGEAWVWSPAWLDLFKRVKVRPRRTLDTSFTPGVGEARAMPARRDGAVDLERIKTRLEEAKPKPRKPAARSAGRGALRGVAPGRDLTSELLAERKRPGPPAPAAGPPRDTALAELALRQRIAEAESLLDGLRDLLALLTGGESPPAPRRGQKWGGTDGQGGRAHVAPMTAEAVAAAVGAPPAAGDLSGPQRRILAELAWWWTVSTQPVDRRQLALLAEQSPKSSGYTNNLGRLRTAGLIDYPQPGTVALTDAGRQVAEMPETPPTEEALQESVIARLPGPQGRILRYLIDVYPKQVGRDFLADATEQSPTSSGYTNNLGRLRSLGLIDYPAPRMVAAAPILFLEERR